MSDSSRHHSRRHRDRDGHRERDSSRRRHRERDSSSSRRDSRRDRDRDRDRIEKSERSSKKRTRSPPPTLPMNAIPISTRDFDLLSSVFSSYLDVQKGLNLSELDERMAKSRFKSFVSHYNRGELARGWYERVLQIQLHGAPVNAPNTALENSINALVSEASQRAPPPKRSRRDEPSSDEDSSEDEFGPKPPGEEEQRTRKGPRAPGFEELELQKELAEEDREARREDLRWERKMDRKRQKEALEDLVPRAEAGTRERMLEKKKEVGEKMRAFREKSAEVEEMNDEVVFGGGEQTLAQKKAAMERKKNERELRREQILKARIAEREERVQGMKEKEERTMAMLKSLAASRFGA